MPELPEVEIYRRYFQEHALEKNIERVRVLDARVLRDISASRLNSSLRNRHFLSTRRHGKHLFAETDDDLWLRIHFGMSGDLYYYPRQALSESAQHPTPRFARVIFDFSNGYSLAYDDARLFGMVSVVEEPSRFVKDQALGPDPLDATFTARRFRALFVGKRGAVKSLLMNQSNIAGLGNLYVDEILFQTGVHPSRSVAAVDPAEIDDMYRIMRTILRTVIARKVRGAGYPAKYLVPRRDPGGNCTRCSGKIGRIVVFGRTTYFCEEHQK
ncbi:MAG TPA: DNA-formamidopyrimidine glycosylase family protein [Thermoanaerobaculia bacterium]|nr:DNA-formamidopyrimidine glycosylase family protein [Thermoanaerobaculia bacterium]